MLTLTAGARHYKFEKSFKGSVSSAFYCFEQGAQAGGCTNGTFYRIDKLPDGRGDTETGTKYRGNLTWHITPDIMLYATYSQGFRPGGFNRQGGLDANGKPTSCHIKGRDGVDQFCLPPVYKSDDLTTKEIGWKMEFLNRHLQVNGAVSQEDWDNVQIGFFDPGELGNLTFGTNGQNFRIRGVETQIVGRAAGLTVQAAASLNWMREQVNSPALIDGNPASVNFGKPITEACTSATNCKPLNNLFGAPGSPPANAPPLQFNLRARYDWTIGGYDAFAQAGMTHSGHSFTQSANNPSIAAGGINTTILRFENPAYDTYDASVGVGKDAWTAHLFAQNLTNVNTSLFTNTGQFVVAESVLRPRVIGLKVGYKF